MKTKNLLLNGIWIVLLVTLPSCTKLLDEKPDRSITTISKFEDLVAILRSYEQINSFGFNIADLGADEYILTSSTFSNLEINHRKAYRWDGDTKIDGWSAFYKAVYYANLVLDGLDKVDGGTSEDRDNLRGQALYFRAFSFFHLAQIYCKPYGQSFVDDPGLPLRLTPNVEEQIVRSTVEETYSRIISDAKDALILMPMNNGAINIPDKLACYGFLSRVYLSMSDYDNAEIYASLYLNESPDLMDYNTLDTLANPSISMNNVESVFIGYYTGLIPGPQIQINPDLLQMYADDDLRRKVLFTQSHDGIVSFKGSYEGLYGFTAYCGIATDEVYLSRAECLARKGNLSGAMTDLNILLENRWVKGTFTPLSATTKEKAVALILNERRKELLFRSLRWSDLRRLNLDGTNITLTRILDGVTYTLPPNDKRWTWLIPDEVIKISGISQNDR